MMGTSPVVVSEDHKGASFLLSSLAPMAATECREADGNESGHVRTSGSSRRSQRDAGSSPADDGREPGGDLLPARPIGEHNI
jgi:hypothetical protein